MKLGDLCSFTVGGQDADFWLVASGDNVGTPVKTFDPTHIAVKVTRTDLLVPQYLFYWMQHTHLSGAFAGVDRVRPADLETIKVQ